MGQLGNRGVLFVTAAAWAHHGNVATYRPVRDNRPTHGGDRAATLGRVSALVKTNRMELILIHQLGPSWVPLRKRCVSCAAELFGA